MKRTIRVAVKCLASPVVLCWQALMLVLGTALVVWDWITEHEDTIYSNSDMMNDYKRNFKQYWLGMFR